MLNFNGSLFLNSKTAYSLIFQFNKSIKWGEIYFSRTNYNIFVKPFTTSLPHLVKYNSDNEWTDETFAQRYAQALKEPKIFLKGFYNFAGEFGKLYEEKKQNFFLNTRQFQYQDPDNNVEMLFTFETEEKLNKFMVTTDAAHYGGYSSASLKVTPGQTGLFSGNVCSELVKDGEAKFSGYASMLSRKNIRSFKRLKLFDWSYYTHLVFKVRGDGRTYYIHFSVKVDFDKDQNWVYSYPLFTRGGPHWQVSKIPFSNFYFISRGKLAQHQPRSIPLKKIIALGLTTRQVDGPFKLEIDYIGLERDENHRLISPYEQYA